MLIATGDVQQGKWRFCPICIWDEVLDVGRLGYGDVV